MSGGQWSCSCRLDKLAMSVGETYGQSSRRPLVEVNVSGATHELPMAHENISPAEWLKELTKRAGSILPRW